MAFRRRSEDDVVVYLATNSDDDGVELWVESDSAYHRVCYLGQDGRLHLTTYGDEEDGSAVGLCLDADGYIEVVRD